MQVTIDIDTFEELYKNSWSGAVDTLDDIRRADKEDELMQHLEEVFADGETPSETTVNDYLWHDREYVYEALGLNENGELPTSVDIAREEGTVWQVTVADLKRAGLFDECFINYVIEMVQTDEDEDGNPIYDEDEPYTIDFDELEINSENEITEEQIDFLNDEC